MALMSQRKERRVAAEQRRLEWRKAWSVLARKELLAGKNLEQAMIVVQRDMTRIVATNPQVSSEVIRAGNEFVSKLTTAIIKAGAPA